MFHNEMDEIRISVSMYVYNSTGYDVFERTSRPFHLMGSLGIAIHGGVRAGFLEIRWDEELNIQWAE